MGREWGGRGAKAYDGEKAEYSINKSFNAVGYYLRHSQSDAVHRKKSFSIFQGNGNIEKLFTV